VPTDMGLSVDPLLGRCLMSIILVWLVKWTTIFACWW